VLRVGLTGGLGSGKSTVAAMFAGLGAHVLSADEIGRGLMQPGNPVYAAIVAAFGASVVSADGALDRAALARFAFTDGRVEELNAIVHPATIAAQARAMDEIAARDASAVAIVESALIFETRLGDGWRDRFDRMILVRAAEARKIERFVARSSGGRELTEVATTELIAEARRRLARQIDDDLKASRCDYVLTNDGTAAELAAQVEALWPSLAEEAVARGR
jgi:dephospho-CoA kinase